MLTDGLLLLATVGPSGSGVVYIMVPGLLDGGGHRDVDRALDDRRDAGRRRKGRRGSPRAS